LSCRNQWDSCTCTCLSWADSGHHWDKADRNMDGYSCLCSHRSVHRPASSEASHWWSPVWTDTRSNVRFVFLYYRYLLISLFY